MLRKRSGSKRMKNGFKEMTPEKRLIEVNTAISNILVGGQSYKEVGTRSLTRADLGKLLEMQRDLQAQLSNQE